MLAHPRDPHRLLAAASLTMALGIVLLLFGVAGAYVFDRHLSLGAVVACHALVILGPTALKIGYVIRLLAQRQLTLRA